MATPWVAFAAAAISALEVWIRVRPTSTVGVVVALSVFALMLIGDAFIGLILSDDAPAVAAYVWHVTSRLAVTGLTLGLGIAAAAVAPHLASVLKWLACGAALVAAVRTATSEYEVFLLRMAHPCSDEVSSGIEDIGIRIRAISLGMVVVGLIIYIIVAAIQYSSEIAPGPGTAVIVLIIILGASIKYDAKLRGATTGIECDHVQAHEPVRAPPNVVEIACLLLVWVAMVVLVIFASLVPPPQREPTKGTQVVGPEKYAEVRKGMTQRETKALLGQASASLKTGFDLSVCRSYRIRAQKGVYALCFTNGWLDGKAKLERIP